MKDPFKNSPVRRVTLKNLHEFKPFLRSTPVPEHPELYEIAKKITHDAGYPYTDPRTLETTQPQPRKKTRMSNSKKMPKWVLLDQLHIDINVKSDMPAKERRELIRLANSESMTSLLKTVIGGTNNKNVRVRITK